MRQRRRAAGAAARDSALLTGWKPACGAALPYRRHGADRLSARACRVVAGAAGFLIGRRDDRAMAMDAARDQAVNDRLLTTAAEQADAASRADREGGGLHAVRTALAPSPVAFLWALAR